MTNVFVATRGGVSLTEIDRIKDFANHIYANYDLNGKAMWENMAIGMGFGD